MRNGQEKKKKKSKNTRDAQKKPPIHLDLAVKVTQVYRRRIQVPCVVFRSVKRLRHSSSEQKGNLLEHTEI